MSRARGRSLTSDLLIGAPSSTGAGTAYLDLWRGRPPRSGHDRRHRRFIKLNRIGATRDVAGATFLGAEGGDATGFAVSSAGDFNGDGLSDFMIGSPIAEAATGTGHLFYGQAGAAAIVGDIVLDDIPTTVPSVTFAGSAVGDLAGFSLSRVGRINNDGHERNPDRGPRVQRPRGGGLSDPRQPEPARGLLARRRPSRSRSPRR